jgi:hypothetical protein
MANNSKNIIVGAGVLYIGADNDEKTVNDIPDVSGGNSGKTFDANTQGTYQNPSNVNNTEWDHVGYTSEGVDFSFEPDYGEVQVDQLLDVAKIYKQGQKVMVKTTLTEATLENFLVVLGGKTGASGDLRATSLHASSKGTTQALDLNGGALGYAPVERSILIVGPGPESLLTSPSNGGTVVERLYLGYRALSMETVSVGIKRNEATVFPVTFRLLPSNLNTTLSQDGNATYGKVIDRVYIG